MPPIHPGDRVDVRVGDTADSAAVRALIADLGGTLAQHGHADVMVVDEWTPEHDAHVSAMRARVGRVTTLAELIIAGHRGQWIAVTGTAGKSSTCHALAHILTAGGRPVRMSRTARSANAWPDWSLVDDAAPPDAVLIAELTSSHLCHMHTSLTPDVAVITLIRDDHPDLHPTPDAYVAAKARLLPPAGKPRAIVLPGDDPSTLDAIPNAPSPDYVFGLDLGERPGASMAAGGLVTLRGHNDHAHAQIADHTSTAARAALAAAAAALALGLPAGAVASSLATVDASPHRQREVGLFRDARVVDDTLAATPRKVLAAVDRYVDQQPVLVMGGDPCAHPPGDVEHTVARITGAGLRVVVFGPMGDAIAPALHAIGAAPTVMGALGIAATAAGAGGLVVVSPMFAMQPAERERVAALPSG
jgi:UDP-N-acetylmuramoylalanine--D-glutamate ligase